MEIAYFFNEKKQFTHSDVLIEKPKAPEIPNDNISIVPIDEKIELPDIEKEIKNYTLVKPEDGLLDPIFWNEKDNKWRAATQEEHDEFHKNDPVEEVQPSETDRAIAQLTFNQATQKVEQDKFNADVLLQIAQIGGTK